MTARSGGLIAPLVAAAYLAASDDLMLVIAIPGIGRVRLGMAVMAALLIAAALLARRSPHEPGSGPDRRRAACWLVTAWVALHAAVSCWGPIGHPRAIGFGLWGLGLGGVAVGLAWLRPPFADCLRWMTLGVTLIGLGQLALFTLGWPSGVMLIWPNGVPRINGLASEPSYWIGIAAAPTIAWACWLGMRGAAVSWGERLWLAAAFAACGFSSSRVGVAVCALAAVLMLAGGWGWRRPALRAAGAWACAGLAVFAATYAVCAWSPRDSRIRADAYLGGLGLADRNTGSIDRRQENAALTWGVFQRHPIIGVGQGGIGPEIAAQRGVVYGSEWHVGEGGLLPELLAATGVVGGVLLAGLALAVAMGLRGPGGWNRELIIGLLALAVVAIGLIYNQNPLRLSAWFLFGLVLSTLRPSGGPIRPLAERQA